MVLVNKLPTSTHTQGTWSGTAHSILNDGNTGTTTVTASLADDVLVEVADVTETSSGALLTSVTAKSTWSNPSAGADGSAVVRRRTAAGALSSSSVHSPGAGISTFNPVFTSGLTTVNDFNGCQWGGAENNYITNPLQYAELNMDVDFIPPAGSWAVFAGSLIGAVTLLQMSQMPALAAAVYARRGLRFRLDELATFYRELREARYPRHFLLQAAA